MCIRDRIFFLPNNMRTAVRYETKEQVVDILKQVGFVTDEIDVYKRQIFEY